MYGWRARAWRALSAMVSIQVSKNEWSECSILSVGCDDVKVRVRCGWAAALQSSQAPQIARKRPAVCASAHCLASFIYAAPHQPTHPELYHILDSLELPCEHTLQSRCSETTTTTIRSHCTSLTPTSMSLGTNLLVVHLKAGYSRSNMLKRLLSRAQ